MSIDGDSETRTASRRGSATFGDASGGEVPYDSVDLVYDDDVYNVASTGGEHAFGATAQNTTSVADSETAGTGQTSVSLINQADALLPAQTYVDDFSTPQFRVESITLNGSDPRPRLQILAREVGDTIRASGAAKAAPDRHHHPHPPQREKTLDVRGDLRCTWSLSRGFNASVTDGRLGVAGLSQVGHTTVAG